jgi:hypothetical protein
VALLLLKLAQLLKLNLKSASTVLKMQFVMQKLQLKRASLPVVALRYYRPDMQFSLS